VKFDNIPERLSFNDTNKHLRDRPGARVAKRRRAQAKIGVNHRITTSETMKWFKTRFDGIIR
jgi:hypothetical protein